MDAQLVNEKFDWEQPSHGVSMKARYQETAEQCKVLQAELDRAIIERNALAAAAAKLKLESDWWFAEGVYGKEEECRIEADFQQQLVYKDRLLIDLTKRVEKGMTAMMKVKERSRMENEDTAAELLT